MVRGARAARHADQHPSHRLPSLLRATLHQRNRAARLQGEEEGEGDEIEQIEGYHIYIGGGFGPQAAIGREIYRDVKAQDVPPVIERMLQGYLDNRESDEETFLDFSRRHEVDALKADV